MPGCLAVRHERRHYLGRNPDRPPRSLVDDRPGRSRAAAQPPVIAAELDVAVEPGALGRIADPGAGGDAVALERRTQIIDLVPHHDPDVPLLVRRVGDAPP